ncbi:MAG TPA: YibE/F family protein [Anaerolineae bacterium]|nr:YibE/F family protein [Anaerolineae bacterium]HQE99920.1 YibE/F family protein [Anaerolineae bacterium]HQJ10313.1 YibE/F family protein [Anaerolineae bacterium]HUM36711.1 YibE/F family protein [Anaerolineae bacterium]
MSHRSAHTNQYLLEGVAILSLILLIIALGVLHVTRPPEKFASQNATQENTVQAKVLAVGDETVSEMPTGEQLYSRDIEVQILSEGPFEGQTMTLNQRRMEQTSSITPRAGQRVLIILAQQPDGQVVPFLADRVRLTPLALLAALFVAVTLGVGRGQGLRALLGLLLSLAAIGGFILPQLLAGRAPLLVTFVGMGALMAVTLYLIQGWNIRTHTAFLALLGCLSVTALLALLWVEVSALTGFGSEETLYLQATGVTLDMRGLLLAGIVIGASGVLDDVVLAQAVSVYEIAEANPALTVREIFRRGMKIGNAHLASMVNTLVLAYASTALPLIILFALYTEPWYLTLNREFIAEEVVRTLVGSLGLLLAVPLTTAIAAWMAPQMGEAAR